MNYFKLLILSGLLFLISSQAPAIGTNEPPIRKGAEVQVKSYDAVTKSVEIKIVKEPAVGPNYTDPAVLATALGFKGEKAKKLVANPMSVKGVVFNLKTDLKLLNFFELTERLPPHLQANIKKAMAEGPKEKGKKSKNK